MSAALQLDLRLNRSALRSSLILVGVFALASWFGVMSGALLLIGPFWIASTWGGCCRSDTAALLNLRSALGISRADRYRARVKLVGIVSALMILLVHAGLFGMYARQQPGGPDGGGAAPDASTGTLISRAASSAETWGLLALSGLGMTLIALVVADRCAPSALPGPTAGGWSWKAPGIAVLTGLLTWLAVIALGAVGKATDLDPGGLVLPVIVLAIAVIVAAFHLRRRLRAVVGENLQA